MYRLSVYSHDPCCFQVEETGDVIAFYNHVFVPVVKTDLLRISQDRKTLPAPPQAEGLHSASPVRSFIRYTTTVLSIRTEQQLQCGLSL